MDKAKLFGLLLGAVVGGYGVYVANLDGSKPLDAGKSALVQGRYDEAIDHFDQVFEEMRRSAQVPLYAVGLTFDKHRTRYEAFKGLAEAHLKKGEVQLAQQYLDEARAINTFDPKITLLTMEIAESRGAFGDAEKAVEQLLKTNPRFYRNYLMRARIRKRMGDCLGQAADYRAALQNLTAGHLQYERIDVLQDLAWLLASHPDPQCRDGAQAVDLLKGVADLVEERYTEQARSRFLAVRAAALAESGDYDGAKAGAERAAALVPADSGEFAAIQRQLNAYNIKEPWREIINSPN